MSVKQINGAEVAKIIEKLKRKGKAMEMAAKVALREGVEEIVFTAKMNCPVKTGALRDSIHSIAENDGVTYKIVADAENENGVQYGKIVEFGAKINRPFLYPAIYQHEKELTGKLKTAMQREIKN